MYSNKSKQIQYLSAISLAVVATIPGCAGVRQTELNIVVVDRHTNAPISEVEARYYPPYYNITGTVSYASEPKNIVFSDIEGSVYIGKAERLNPGESGRIEFRHEEYVSRYIHIGIIDSDHSMGESVFAGQSYHAYLSHSMHDDSPIVIYLKKK